MTQRKWLMRALRLIVIAALVIGMVVLLRGMKLHDLGDALMRATLWPIAVAAVLSFANMLGKAACWRVLLHRHPLPVLTHYRYVLTAFAASAIVPARAGEIWRIWVLRQRHEVPAATSTAVAIAEKILDGLAMAIFVAPLPWLLPGLPSWVGRTIIIVGVAGLVLIVGLAVAAGRIRGTGHFARFFAAMELLRRPLVTLGALAICYLGWLIDLGEVLLILHAVGVHLPWAAGLLILLTLNLAIMVPSTPGQVGALEVGAMIALDQLGVAKGPALAFALIYHAMQIVPLVAVGAILDWRLVLGRRKPEAAAGIGT